MDSLTLRAAVGGRTLFEGFRPSLHQGYIQEKSPGI